MTSLGWKVPILYLLKACRALTCFFRQNVITQICSMITQICSVTTQICSAITEICSAITQICSVITQVCSVWDESPLGKRQFLFLEICDTLSAKPGHFNLSRPLMDGYFIVKWHCYIYRQLDRHFKRFIAIIWLFEYRRYFLNSSISTMFVVFKP